MARATAACIAIVSVLALSACRADVLVTLTAEADGSGHVRVRVDLDEEAARHVGDLRREIEAADLRAAGWTVAYPEGRAGGSAVEARRRFSSDVEASAVLSQLTGANGPFRNLRLEQERTALATRTHLSGAIDLSGGIAAFGDSGLVRLTGAPTGIAPDAAEQPSATSVAFHFRADLPGSGLPLRWDPRMGETVAVDARATSTNVRGILALLGALASAIAAVVLVARRLRRTG